MVAAFFPFSFSFPRPSPPTTVFPLLDIFSWVRIFYLPVLLVNVCLHNFTSLWILSCSKPSRNEWDSPGTWGAASTSSVPSRPSPEGGICVTSFASFAWDHWQTVCSITLHLAKSSVITEPGETEMILPVAPAPQLMTSLITVSGLGCFLSPVFSESLGSSPCGNVLNSTLASAFEKWGHE